MTSMSFVLRSIWLLPLMLIASVLYFVVALCAILLGLMRELIVAMLTVAPRLRATGDIAPLTNLKVITRAIRGRRLRA